MIYQGSNLPIVIKFKDGLVEYDFVEISLRKNDDEIKHWSKEDVIVSEDSIICPISQNESVDWEVGLYKLECKILDKLGATRFMQSKRLNVFKHGDDTIMGDGTACSMIVEVDDIDIDSMTNAIVFKYDSESYDDTEIRQMIGEKDDKPMVVEFVPELGNMSRDVLAEIPVVAENYTLEEVIEAYQSARRVYASFVVSDVIILELTAASEMGVQFDKIASQSFGNDSVTTQSVQIMCFSDTSSDGKIHGMFKIAMDDVPIAKYSADGKIAYQNPTKLKITGAVSAEYDGSEEVTVEIPQGGTSYDDTEIRQLIGTKADENLTLKTYTAKDIDSDIYILKPDGEKMNYSDIREFIARPDINYIKINYNGYLYSYDYFKSNSSTTVFSCIYESHSSGSNDISIFAMEMRFLSWENGSGRTSVAQNASIPHNIDGYVKERIPTTRVVYNAEITGGNQYGSIVTIKGVSYSDIREKADAGVAVFIKVPMGFTLPLESKYNGSMEFRFTQIYKASYISGSNERLGFNEFFIRLLDSEGDASANILIRSGYIAEKSEVPTDAHINSLIDAKIGALDALIGSGVIE